MKNTLTVLLLLLSITGPLKAQVPSIVWVKSAPGTPGSIVYNNGGKVYYNGYTNANIFVNRLDSSGNLVLGKDFVSSGGGDAESIDVDNNGNVYSMGSFSGTVDFDPGSAFYGLTSSNNWNVYVSKLDSVGNFIMAAKLGGEVTAGMCSGETYGYSMDVDDAGNVYSTGSFEDTSDFNPGISIYNLIADSIFDCTNPPPGPYTGLYDVFLSKLNTSGNFNWARQIGGKMGDRGRSICSHSSGNIYEAGYFEDTCKFDHDGDYPFPMLAIGDYDVFLCKRNQYGYYVWAKQLDVTGINKNRPMVITPDQGIILTGWFSGTVDFDPGPGIVSLTSAGGEDIFILKLNSAGNLVWVKQMGGTSNDKGSSITLDDNGNIYIVGGFSGLADFNPGTGVYNMIANDHDIFITRLDNQGSFVWAAQLDGSGLSNNFAPYSYENLSLTIDEFENIYIMGPFSGTVDFDPGPNQISLTSIGTKDIFILKLSQIGSFINLSGDLSFGNVEVGQSANQTFTITNLGNANLLIDSISYPYPVFSGNWNGIIPPGESQTIIATFYPTEAFSYNGNLIVHSNASSGNNFHLITGTGILQATNITVTNVSSYHFSFNWTGGSFANRAVFIKQDSLGTTSPANNTTYTASTVFGSGFQIGSTGWYCIFNGTTHATGVTVTNLLPNTNYRVMVCEYNGGAGNEQYNSSTAYGNPINQQTVGQVAPVTIAPVKGVPLNSAIKIPITVIGFDSITACTLRLEYDPAVLSYAGYSNVNSQLSSMLVNDLPDSALLRKVIIVWSDVDPKTLPSNSKLLDLDFTYLSGTTALTWNNTANGGADCEYADAVGDPLPDVPSYQYYIDGEVHWQPGYQVSGVISYNNAANTALDQVEVNLLQNAIPVNSAISNTSGFYEFSVIPNGSYIAQFLCSKPLAGVNATDALKVQRHAAGLEIITEPVRLQAADVNNSNSINATDALKIKRRVVGLDTTFARGNWTFAKPTISGDTIVVSGANITQNFYGLCVGDVNGSNTPAPGDSPNAASVMITHNGEIEVGPGQEFDLPIRIISDNMVNAISLVIPYPSDLLEVLDILTPIGIPAYSALNDNIRIAWSELQSLNLNFGETLILLKLKATAKFTRDQSIALVANNESELSDETGIVIPIAELFTQTIKTLNSTGIDDPNSIPKEFAVYPNPATDVLNIEVVINKKASMDIEIIDMLGKVITSKEMGEIAPGINAFRINTSNISNGVYTIKINLNGDNDKSSYLFKVVISK